MSGYDERLLASAPVATRAEKQVRLVPFRYLFRGHRSAGGRREVQVEDEGGATLRQDRTLMPDAPMQEGYNIDLLEDDQTPAGRSVSTTPPPVPPHAVADPAKAEAGYAGTAYAAPPTPWYKTRKWLIIMLVGGIVVVAAVVGGAVGGALSNKNSGSGKVELASSSSIPAATTTSAADNGGGGTGPATTTGSGESPQQTASSTASTTAAAPGQSESTTVPGQGLAAAPTPESQ